MKKTLISYLIILIGVFVLFSFLDYNGEYVIEQKLWKIQRQFIDIAKDPEAVPDFKFDEVAGQYQKVIDKYPDSRLIRNVHFALGRLYLVKKDYVTAREKFHLVAEKYSDNKELSAEALLFVGKAYEVEGNWPQADKTYQSVIDNYPMTMTGLGVPIYVANYYKRKNDFQNTMNAYEKAVIHYRKMASDHDGTKVGLKAMGYLSNCFLEQSRWNEAIETLGLIIEKYSTTGHLTPKNVNLTIKTINIVSAYQLKDYDIAIRMYQGIIDRNPELPFRAYLEKVIDAFNQLKEKGVRILERK